MTDSGFTSLRSVPTAKASEDSPILQSRGAWRCFHCDDLFTTRWAARDHFGNDESATPACQIKAGEIGLVEALRRAEADVSEAWGMIHTESTEAAKAYFAQQSRHQAQMTALEQAGYDRGIADAKAHPETLVPPELEAWLQIRGLMPSGPYDIAQIIAMLNHHEQALADAGLGGGQ